MNTLVDKSVGLYTDEDTGIHLHLDTDWMCIYTDIHDTYNLYNVRGAKCIARS